MTDWTQTMRCVLPGAMLAALAGISGCAQTMPAPVVSAGACQGLRLALDNPSAQSHCGMRGSAALLPSGRPLYTVVEAQEPPYRLRLVLVDAQLVRLESVGAMQAGALPAQQLADGVIKP